MATAKVFFYIRAISNGKVGTAVIFLSLLTESVWCHGHVVDFALGSGGPGFESWLCQVDLGSMEKTIYMHFLFPLICKIRTQL